MSKIKIMDELLANKIAAGEVVEKCVSIVKELVENAIDAKSDYIKIELKEAGLREIKVIDNGIGMDKNDAILAFQRHATSKLYTDDDLFSISSLGFRGEALPSIASVSEVILKTCQNDQGYFVHIKGGKILESGNSEAREGTSITVTNLFYNTPARLKHLSSIYTELSNIVEYVNKISLSYPYIKFVLKNDDKELINTDGSGNLLKVIKTIYGKDVAKKMLKIEIANDDYSISGYVSLPEVNRSSRNHMTTIVNGRVVKNITLNKIVNDAYATFKEDTRYPISVLVIDTDPSLIDVNIHPSKQDIKFSNFDELKDLIKKVIIDAIRDKMLIPKIELKEKEEIKYENLTLNLERDVVSEETNIYTNKLSDKINFKTESEDELEEVYIEKIENNNKLPELYPIGLFLGTYIGCQNEKGIYLIDQHAAQERINYEKYLYLLSHPNNNTIEPLFPIIIELPMNEFIIIKKNLEILQNLNIKIEEFGISSFRVLQHPTWFTKNNESRIMKEIFELIISNEKNFSLEKFNHNLAATIACKASIKGNTNITIEAMENLINDLRKCDNPYNCPHGRPTIIHYSIYEIEKMFKRSM